ncbi:MAG: hypothetical protein ACOC80_10200, partial [Petrotogales bacterium]
FEIGQEYFIKTIHDKIEGILCGDEKDEGSILVFDGERYLKLIKNKIEYSKRINKNSYPNYVSPDCDLHVDFKVKTIDDDTLFIKKTFWEAYDRSNKYDDVFIVYKLMLEDLYEMHIDQKDVVEIDTSETTQYFDIGDEFLGPPLGHRFVLEGIEDGFCVLKNTVTGDVFKISISNLKTAIENDEFQKI